MKRKWMFQHLLPMLGIAITIVLLNPAAQATIHVGSSSWVWQNPLPQGNTLNAISCPTLNVCFAVGDLGTILATTNGGSLTPTWSAQPSPTTQNLRGISCPDTTSCVAVGDNGTVLTYFMLCLFGSCSSGWILEPNFSPSLQAVSCPAVGTCFAVAGGRDIWGTTDDGHSWSAVTHSTFVEDSLTAISCPVTTACFAVGPVVGGVGNSRPILKYALEFGVFQTDLLSAQDQNGFTAISCSSATGGVTDRTRAACVAVDGKGNAVYTSDSTIEPWPETPVTSVPLNSVSCVPATSTCYAVGPSNLVFGTLTGGSSWFSLASNETTTAPLLGVSCAAGNVCFAVGFDGAIITNSPVGGFWKSLQTTVTNNIMRRISCPVQGTCFAVGDSGTILTTINGGTTWTLQSSGTTLTLYGVSCPTISTCFAVGANGTILTYNGSTWSPQSSGTTSPLIGISCPSASVCFAVGRGILATTNGGATWTTQVSFPLPYELVSITCTSTTTCVAVGNGGSLGAGILATATGGAPWKGQNILAQSPPALFDVNCPTAATCVAVGEAGTILATANFPGTNGVATWSPQSSPTTDDLASVSCLASRLFGTICEAGSQGTHFSIPTHLISSQGSTWALEATLDPPLYGMSCQGTALTALPSFQCIAVGGGVPGPHIGTIISLKVSNSLGTSELTPRGGNSQVGEETTFQITWTVPDGQSWRELQNLDLKLMHDSDVGLWARFYVGDPSTFALLDADGNVVGVGLPGSSGTLESSTATLDLANSSFEGSGPTGPSVTVNFVVSFKPAAAGEHGARVYETEISATDLEGAIQGPEQVGHWVVRP